MNKPLVPQNDRVRHLAAGPLAPLTALAQWCGWRWAQGADGKWQPSPVIATAPDRPASADDPETWCDYGTALAVAQARNVDGIAFVLTPADPFIAMDLGDCRHPRTRSIDIWAQNFLDVTREAYAEATPSGEGITIWGLTAKVAAEVKGTLAARYLSETRGIDLDLLPNNVDDVLRFHPRCVFGPGVQYPCLIALMRDACGDTPIGIQRIALTPDAQKIDRWMLGLSGVVKLWPASKQLVVGEGLETTLAAATRLDYRDEPLRPAWAALSDGGLKKFPIISGVERLVVLADNDANNAGAKAAEACKRRWLEAGRRVALLMPDRPGTDFNDIVLSNLEHAS